MKKKYFYFDRSSLNMNKPSSSKAVEWEANKSNFGKNMIRIDLVEIKLFPTLGELECPLWEFRL
jgi:hypothetical protein